MMDRLSWKESKSTIQKGIILKMDNKRRGKAEENKNPYVIRTSNQNEKPELLRMECKNCGASLELTDRTHAFCPYCGQKYLIDEAKGTMVHIQVDYSGSDEMYEAVSSTKKVLIVFLIVASLIALIIFGFNIAARKSLFSKSDADLPVDEKGQLLVIFCKDIFGKEFKEITQEEFASVKYLRCAYERENGEMFNVISYSFTDYEACPSEEAFQETVKTWSYRSKQVSWPSDYTMFTGLTRIDTTDTVWLSLLKFSPDAPIRYIDTDDKLPTISNVLNPEQIKVMHIGLMGTSLEGIEQYKNLEELEVDTNLSSQSMNLDGIEQCQKLKTLRLRCGDAYTGLDNLKKLPNLTSLYLDHVPLEDCSFLENLQTLEELSIYTGEEASLSILESLPNLKRVHFLDGEYILPEEIPLLKGVEELTIAIKEQEGLQELSALDTLKVLDLHMSIHGYQTPVDVSVLGNLPGLRWLKMDNFWGEEITGLEEILKLPELSVFWLGHKGSSDIVPLFTIEALEGNPSLEEIGLWQCFPKDAATKEPLDFSFLTLFPNVKRLYLDGCDLMDLSFAAELSNLRACSLQDNDILDLSPLLMCKKLEIIAVDKQAAASARFPADVTIHTEPYIRIYEEDS